MKEVILAGASGLVGSELLSLLLAEDRITSVVALVRNPLQTEHIKLKQLIVNFDHLESYEKFVKGNAVYCCLGTTRKKTPDKEEYRKIDYGYPLALAKIASKNGVEQYHLISSMGANKKSFIFYSRLKGELEEQIKAIDFKKTCIYQPSFLTGKRKEERYMENIATRLIKWLDPLLPGQFSKYKSIPARAVAKAMLSNTFSTKEGIFTYPSDFIKNL